MFDHVYYVYNMYTQETVRYIATELDEMEREDFVRLKKVCVAVVWQHVAACCSVLQSRENFVRLQRVFYMCVAVRCSVLQHFAVCCRVWRTSCASRRSLKCVLHCVAVRYSVLQRNAVRWGLLAPREGLVCVAVWCNALHTRHVRKKHMQHELP